MPKWNKYEEGAARVGVRYGVGGVRRSAACCGTAPNNKSPGHPEMLRPDPVSGCLPPWWRHRPAIGKHRRASRAGLCRPPTNSIDSGVSCSVQEWFTPCLFTNSGTKAHVWTQFVSFQTPFACNKRFYFYFCFILTHNSPKYLEWNLPSEELKGFFPLKYAILGFLTRLNY